MPNIGSLFVELGVNAGAFVEGMSKATYKAKQSAKEIGEAFKNIGHDLGGILGQFGEFGDIIGETLGSAGETIAKFSGQLGSISGAAGAAAIGVAALGAVAIAAAVGLTKMAIAGAEYVHELSQVSQKTGISIQDLQALKAAGATVGLGLDAMVTGFRKFDQALIGTGRGSDIAQAQLRSLGVTSRDNKEALYQVADAFSKMENGPEKAATAIALFGRSGLNLIPILNKGAAGLREFEAVSEEYGPRIGRNAVDAAEANEQYLMAQQKLSLAWDRFLVSAETKILPTVTKVTTWMADQAKAIGDLVDKLNSLPGAAEVAARALSGLVHAGTGFDTAGYIDRVRGIYNADKAGNGPNTTKNSTAAASRAIGQANDDEIAKKKEYFDLAEKSGESELKYSYRQLALLEEQRKIEELKVRGKWDEATAESATLAKLKDAADIEKKQNELRRNPVTITPGKDPSREMIQDLDNQLSKQSELSKSVDDTSLSIAVYTAEQTKRIEIDKKASDLTKEIAAKQVELRAAYKEPAKQSEISQKIAELTKFRDALDKNAPDIIARAGAVALAGGTNKASSGVQQQATVLEEQAAAMQKVTAAYQGGYEAIRNAEIDKSVLKEQVAVDNARAAYDKFAAVHGELAGTLSGEKTALDGTTAALTRARNAAGQMIDLKLEDKLNKERDALVADGLAWKLNNDAIGQGMLARVQAEEAAARVKAAADKNNSPAQVDLAGIAARQKAIEAAASSTTQAAQAMDLVAAYKEQIAQLELIKAEYKDNAVIQLQVTSQEHDLLQKMNHDWDQAAFKVGTFGQQSAAIFNELVLDGQDFWSKFMQSGLTAIQGVEDALAKFAVTGKGNFKQVLTGFEEGFAKNGIQALVSKGASSLLGSTGLGGLIPGFGQASRDGKTEAGAMWVEITKSSASVFAGLAGGTGGPSASGLSSLPNLFGSMGGGGALGILGTIGSAFGLPFLADGGDVTPGKAYVVGEDHPEFFVPHTGGTVVPELKTGGSSQNVNNFHFHGVTDFDSFKKNQTQVSQQVSSAVGKGNGRR